MLSVEICFKLIHFLFLNSKRKIVNSEYSRKRLYVLCIFILNQKSVNRYQRAL